MHNSLIDIKDNKAFIENSIAQIFILLKQNYKATAFFIRYFIEGTEEEVSGDTLKKFTDKLATIIAPEKASETIDLLLSMRKECLNNKELTEFSVNSANNFMILQATTDAFNNYLGYNPKSFVDRVAPQHASTSEHQSHVERYVDPAIVKAKAESMESDIESSQSSLRRRHVPENIKSEGASSQTFVEKYADHKKDKPEKGCLETVRAATGGYCSIQ